MIKLSYKVNGIEYHTTINRPVSDYGFELDGDVVKVETNEHIDHDFRHLPEPPDNNTITYSDGEGKRAMHALRIAYGMWRRTPVDEVPPE